MMAITSGSVSPKVSAIASNGVRSSHAISTIRDNSEGVKSGVLARFIAFFSLRLFHKPGQFDCAWYQYELHNRMF